MRTFQKVTLTFILALAAAFAYERVIYTDDFLYEQSKVEVKINKSKQVLLKSIDEDKRDVASSERDLPTVQYIHYNTHNQARINGQWKVTKIINHLEEVVFDVNQNYEDENTNLLMKFQLKGTSLVRAIYREGKTKESYYFDISFLSERATTIALFRAYEDGYEIIEAKKVESVRGRRSLKPMRNSLSNNMKNTQKIQAEAEEVIQPRSPRVLRLEHVGATLPIERAVYPSRSKGVLQAELIEGSITFGENSIESLSISLLVGTPNEFAIELNPSDISDVGHFHFEEEDASGNLVRASGLVTNNGQGGYRIRFVNGRHAGAMLSFVTLEEQDLMREKAQELAISKAVGATDIEQELVADEAPNDNREEYQEEYDEEPAAEYASEAQDDEYEEDLNYDQEEVEYSDEANVNDHVEAEVNVEKRSPGSVKAPRGFSFSNNPL